MEKERKQVYYPFLHSTTVRYYNYVLHVHSIQWNAGMGNTDTLHSISLLVTKILF